LISNNEAIDFLVMAIVITPNILSSRNLAQEALADSEAEGFGLGKIAESEEVPGINFELLLCCINLVNHVDAIKTFQQALKNDKNSKGFQLRLSINPHKKHAPDHRLGLCVLQ
jgi:hypothetical protein